MSSTDERLSDLLAQRARQGSGVHPTREGVGIAVTRRAARRCRKRTVVTGLAGLCLVAGAVGGLALAGDDDGQEDGFTAPTGPLPEVPLVGMNINDFELTSATIAPVEDSGEPPFTSVTFRSADSLAQPLMNVAVDPDLGDGIPVEPDGTPVDLDGDGQSDGAADGWLTSTPSGTVVEWFLDDGRIAGVGGYGLEEEAVLAYVSQIAGESLDVATVPAPDGLPERSVSTIPSGLPVEEATATYSNGDGEVRVTTRNEPGTFDILQLYGTSTYGGFEAAEVGDAFIGPSRAIVSEPAPGHPYALILTDSGLTIEISTESSDALAPLALELQDLLAAGAFVEVEPTAGPPPTTDLGPATTVPGPAPSTTVPPAQALPSVTRAVDESGEHIRFAFEDFQPPVGTLTILEALNPPCDRLAADHERIFRANRGDPYWRGWMTIDLGARFAADPTAVFVPGELGYILCGHTADTTTFAIPIANLGEPTVTPLSGLPEILVDIPR